MKSRQLEHLPEPNVGCYKTTCIQSDCVEHDFAYEKSLNMWMPPFLDKPISNINNQGGRAASKLDF